jgi:aerobic carbon-monoxide dehydrogenase large subunit
MGVRHFGASVARLEDPRLLKGGGRYLDDIQMSGLLHAAFVRSQSAHARINGLDKAAALELPGIAAIFTAEDLESVAAGPMPQMAPHPALKQPFAYHPLAKDAVHHVGEAMALVLAETRHAAEDAANAVFADLDELPAIADARRALEPGAALVHIGAPDNLAGTLRAGFGNVEHVFRTADHTLTEHFALHRGGCHAMECRGVIAQYDAAGDVVTLWSSTQAPYSVRRLLSAYLGRDEAQVRVIAPDVGGGFGPKAGVYAEEFALALAAIKTGRPIKWVEDRREHFVTTTQQRDQFWTLEVAFSADGRMRGIRGRCIHENGAYLPYGLILPATVLGSFPGPYALEALDITLDVVMTNLVPNSPVRGAGRPNTAFVLERLADRVASYLKMPREEVRRKSFVRAEQMPYVTGMKARDGSPVSYDSGDYRAALDLALEKADAASFPARKAAARAQGKFLGLGIASCVEDTGIGPFEGATVRVTSAGRVVITTGAASQGQGHTTVFAQICADALGVELDKITVEAADTAKFPTGIGTIGSRIAVTGGSSVALAAQRVRAKALKAASEMLEVAESDLDIEDGVIRVAGVPGMSLKLADIAKRLQGATGIPMLAGIEPDLAATAYFDSRATTFAYGTNVCEVEVDRETGGVKLLRYVVAHDCGRLINPLLVDGQIRGGVVHGIGNALFERMIFSEDGQPLTSNYGEYLLPTALEMPNIEIHHIETPSPLNPLGVKGAGEGGTIPATAAVISAIEDALSERGIFIGEHPISPERLLDLAAGACTPL